MTTTNPGPIRLDCSSTGIVVWCAEHPYWRAFRFLKADAWDAACGHEELCHDADYHQRNARSKRAERARHTVHS